jgi:cyclic pyranopterin phosphate synthase
VEFSHLDNEGNAKMVDVSLKEMVKRTAIAKAKILLQPETIKLLSESQLKKGDVLTVAKIAGINAAKKTSDLIPLSHNIQLEWVDLAFNITDDGVEIISTVIASYKTGIEIEAITAVSVAAITIYDMCKAVDKKMMITDIQLVNKKKESI